MKILVIGSGGREHALAWRLAQCQDVTRVYVAPGNAGTDADPTLENLPITDIEALAQRGVVATLLPLTAFALKEPYARGRDMIDAGCAVALATDLNPGSCFSGSIPLTFALACIYMHLTVEEAITALTLNGAAALNRADRIGSIEVGKKGDFVVLDTDNYHFLPYYVGMNCVNTTIKEGVLYPLS